MTNADVIRSMTDKQLDEFLAQFEIGDIDYAVTFCDWCKGNGNELGLDCDGCRTHWLTEDASAYNGLNGWLRHNGYEAAQEGTEPKGWIPVSERLPSAEDCPMDCMVTRRSKYVGNYTDMAVAEANGTWTHEDWKAITIKGEATCISTRDADVIAWMPLPTPYKGGDTE